MLAAWTPPASVPTRRLRRVEYDQLVELGAFEREKLELIRGALIPMSPTKPPHSFALQELVQRFATALGGRAVLRVQSPYVAADDSEPEPDLAVVPAGNYRAAHPSTAELIIEVADSSLRYDRDVKAPLYAESHVREFWLISLERRQVEVYRDPAFGRWSTTFTVSDAGTLAPVAFPDVIITVADILP